MMFPSPVAVPPIMTPGVAAHDQSERAVAQGRGAGEVGADAIAQQSRRRRRGCPRDRHARQCVGRDHVAHALRRPADGDAQGIVDRHSRAASWAAAWFRSGPCRCSRPRPRVFVAPASMSIPSPILPEITLPAGAVSRTDGGTCPARDDDAGGQVADRGRALVVSADQVSRHVGPRRGRTRDQHPFCISRNKVTPPGGWPSRSCWTRNHCR